MSKKEEKLIFLSWVFPYLRQKEWPCTLNIFIVMLNLMTVLSTGELLLKKEKSGSLPSGCANKKFDRKNKGLKSPIIVSEGSYLCYKKIAIMLASYYIEIFILVLFVRLFPILISR